MRYTPRHYAEALLRTLEEAPAKEHAALLKYFVRMLSQNNDMQEWKGVAEELERVYNEKHRIQKVTIAAATPEDARTARRAFTGKKYDVTELIDPSLGGGAAIRVEDLMADSTVRARLSELRAALMR